MPKNFENISLSVDTTKKHAELYLFGAIGSWWDGNTANDVLHTLGNHKDLDTIKVNLASVGGTFLDGLPIYNILNQHNAEVTINIMGYALSMATVIMLAGDKIQAAQNSLIMIHNAQGFAYGSSHEMRKTAALLDKHEQAIMPRYRERMGLSTEDIQALLDEETWYTADEALAAGLVDSITDPVDLDDADKKQTDNSWQFANEYFKHPPADFAARVQNATHKQRPLMQRLISAAVGEPSPPILNPDNSLDDSDDEDTMTPEQIEALTNGITASVTAAVIAAVRPEPEPEPEVAEESPELVTAKAKLADSDAENVSLKADLEAANAKIAELEEEVPGTPTPLNTGPSGDEKYAGEFEG